MTDVIDKGWVGRKARLVTHAGATVEGRVVAYCDTPTVEIEDTESGRRVSLAVSVIAHAESSKCPTCGGTGVAW